MSITVQKTMVSIWKEKEEQNKFPCCLWGESRPSIPYILPKYSLQGAYHFMLRVNTVSYSVCNVLCLTAFVYSLHLIKMLIICSQSIFFSIQWHLPLDIYMQTYRSQSWSEQSSRRPCFFLTFPQKGLAFLYHCYLQKFFALAKTK